MDTVKDTPTKPKYNLWQNSAYMIRLAWGTRRSVLWLCVAVAALAVITNLINLFVTPVILGALESGVSMSGLITAILGFSAALMAAGALTAYVDQNKMFGRIEVRGCIVIHLAEKFMTTSLPNTEDQGMQKLLEKSRQTVNSNQSAGEAVWNTLTEILQNTAGLIIYVAMLAAVNPLLIAIVLVTTVTGFFVSNRINEWGYRHRDEESEYDHRLNYVEKIARERTAAKDLRIFGMRGWLEDVYGDTLRLYKSFIARGEKVYIWADVVELLLTLLRNGAAYAYLIAIVLEGGMSAAQFLLYFTAIGGFTAWVNGVLKGFATLNKQSLDLSTVREFLEFPEPFLFDEGEPLVSDKNHQYAIELRGVSFKYPGAEDYTLKDINLTIHPGEKLAVVGLNGAGKTTLVKLMCGFIDPTEGAVLLDGHDIRRYNRRDYYRLFSAVFQDFSLLASEIAVNIAQTTEDIDMEAVKSATAMAGLEDVIAQLPKQYDTPLGKEVYEDSVELSGGQIQRLMLARALHKDAPIIVLDEPTAALDPIAESDIYNKYHQLTGGRTSVYISHRLASTRFCDRIVLVEGSGIAEEGTHETLIAQGGRYAELFEIQSRYYRQEGAQLDGAIHVEGGAEHE